VNALANNSRFPKVPDHLIVIARVGGAQGIKGWVKLHPETSPKTQAFDYSPWLILLDGQWQAVDLAEWQVHGNGYIGRFEGCRDRTQAEQYRNAWIAVAKDSLPETEEDEFYYHQLEGLSVVTQQEVVLGNVSYLFNTGSNDVMVVKPSKDSLDDKERLLPYLAPYVIRTDLAAGVIQVDWDPEF
jgi:16S rRNA processing protein RimM